MITAVDTNVLLDVLLSDPSHQAIQDGSLIVGDVLASELGAQFAATSDMERFLKSVNIGLISMSLTACHDSGQRWRHHLRTP